jgi:ABC-2 type transport system ATP-binding protein
MSKSSSATPAIYVEKVSKVYADGFKAVKNVSFSIMPGDFTVLLGLNGAGKTSLISMINSLSHMTSGKIAIDGFDIITDSYQAKQRLGIVPQEINFNPFLTVMDSLCYHGGFFGTPRDQVIKIAKPLLQKARLWSKRDTDVGSLSGGMKRMLMLIRALVHEPSVLILDEPTANLDIEIRDTIWDILKSYKKDNLTILLTTHNLMEAQELCDNLLILHHGTLMRDQSIHEAIMSLQERFYTLTFTQPYKKTQLKPFSYTPIDDSRVVLQLAQKDSLSDLLQKLSGQGLEIADLTRSSNQLEQLLRQATAN